LVKKFFKRKLRQCWKPILKLRDRLRGVKGTNLTHVEIAGLIGRADPTILEIGCNDGSDTLRFLKATPRAKLFCFEPDPRAIARFKKKLGRRFKDVKLFEIALSDRNGQIDFHVSDGEDPGLPQGWDKSGSIRRPKEHLKVVPSVKFERTVKVNTRRLDDWAAENDVQRVDFIWMDVQGAEADVILGAAKILRETRFLYTEYSDVELYEGQRPLKELLALLPSFDVVTRYPGDVLLRNTAFVGDHESATLR
jgi:FkbM family methyltransferase